MAEPGGLPSMCRTESDTTEATQQQQQKTVAHQAPLSVEFSRKDYWSGLPLPSPRVLPDTGIELTSLHFLRCRQILYH